MRKRGLLTLLERPVGWRGHAGFSDQVLQYAGKDLLLIIPGCEARVSYLRKGLTGVCQHGMAVVGAFRSGPGRSGRVRAGPCGEGRIGVGSATHKG